jgi:hypothetical protein
MGREGRRGRQGKGKGDEGRRRETRYCKEK